MSSKPQVAARRRDKGLQKLGVSENDVRIAERLINQIPLCPSESSSKAERILGYTQKGLGRDKALRLLGASEYEVELENAKNLGSLGFEGRRRSWSPADFDSVHQINQTRRRASEYCPRPRMKRHTVSVTMKRHTISSTSRNEGFRRTSRIFGTPLHSQVNRNINQ